MNSRALRNLKVGDQLGNLEYVVDQPLTDWYQSIAGPDAAYPNLAADDGKAILLAKTGAGELRTVWRRYTFLRPPTPGRRVQVGGWLRCRREQDGIPWLKVATFAVDEIGTEILRAEAMFAGGAGRQSGATVSSLVDPGYAPDQGCDDLRDAPAGSSIALGCWTMPGPGPAARYDDCRGKLAGIRFPDDGNGPTELLAGRLEGLLTGQFGADFSWGGSLALTFPAAARPGQLVQATAFVTGRDRQPDGTARTKLVIQLRGNDGRQLALGEAAVAIPSPRLR